MTRRSLLRSTGLVLVSSAILDACAQNGSNPPTPTVTVQQVVSVAQNTINTAVQEFSVISPNLSAQQQATLAQVTNALKQAQGILAPLQTTMAANQALPSIQQAEQDFNSVVAAVALVPLPPPYNVAVGALALSLPILEGFINTYVPTASVSLVAMSSRQKVLNGLSASEKAKAQAIVDKGKAAGR